MRISSDIANSVTICALFWLFAANLAGCKNGEATSQPADVESTEADVESETESDPSPETLAEKIPLDERAIKLVIHIDDGLGGLVEDGDRIDLVDVYQVDANGELGSPIPAKRSIPRGWRKPDLGH